MEWKRTRAKQYSQNAKEGGRETGRAAITTADLELFGKHGGGRNVNNMRNEIFTEKKYIQILSCLSKTIDLFGCVETTGQTSGPGGLNHGVCRGCSARGG